MILTGKAAKYAEAVMPIMEKAEKRPMSEQDQANLFAITQLYELDEVFKLMTNSYLNAYTEAYFEGPGGLIRLSKALERKALERR